MLKQTAFYAPSGIRTQELMHPAGGKASPSCDWPPTRPAADGFPAVNFPPRWLSTAQRSFSEEQQYGQMGQSS